MIGQTIAIVAGLAVVGLMAYRDYRVQGTDWLFGSAVTLALYATVVFSVGGQS